MIEIKKIVQQGDITILRIDEGQLPQDLAELPREDGLAIVAHSETGHHHAFDAPPTAVQLFGTAKDPLSVFVRVNSPVALKHFRAWDTHQPIMFKTGIYEIKRQRITDPITKRLRAVID
jgi:hypothetical protein